MIRVLADNIISPLGINTEQNLQHIVAGDSALCRYEGKWALPDAFVASLFSDEQWEELCVIGLTRFESLLYRSVSEALSHLNENELLMLRGTDDAKTCFIVSTTKANVELLGCEHYDENMPAEAAQKVASMLELKTKPIVVCNACISGVAAQVLAERLLNTGAYEHAIVVGCDVQSRFIVSGFQSLKATSDFECRPFDIERLGLNLGEGAATIILSRQDDSCLMHTSDGPEPQSSDETDRTEWYLHAGALSNDAFHITNPSPKGVGSAAVISAVTEGKLADQLALINAHGTATMYNDQMESKAIESAELSSVPMNALKGYYGHTMGAAGLLETILSIRCVERGVVVGTRGFDEIGVSGKVNIDASNRQTTGGDVLKMISGFGGCNAAVLYSQTASPFVLSKDIEVTNTHSVRITTDCICVDGEPIETEETGKAMLTHAYKKYVGDYPKFYKMDILGKVGFLASELLLQCEGKERFIDCDDRAVILMNHSSSLQADNEYLASISHEDEFYPSPSVFVYTLPNIVTGEIAIRNHYHGETSFYVLQSNDEQQMSEIINASFLSKKTNSMIAGWVDATDTENFEAHIYILNKV